MDETILRRLAYVKSLYNISRQQYQKSSDIEISRSIVSLDNTIEAYFWIVLQEKEPDKVKSLHNNSFSDLLKEIEKFIAFDANSIRELHTVRNNIQHGTFLVAESQARRYYPVIEKMFNSSCKSIFDIEWKDVSISLLIDDEQVRKFMQIAEKSFEVNDYRRSAKYLIMAFEIAKMFRQFGQAGSGISLLRVPEEFVTYESEFNQAIVKYTAKIEQEVEVLKLGLDYAQWLSYRRELGNLNPLNYLYADVDKELDESKILLFQEDEETIEFWYRRNFSFVQETIFKWQDSMLNIGDFLHKFAETLNEMGDKSKVPVSNKSLLDTDK